MTFTFPPGACCLRHLEKKRSRCCLYCARSTPSPPPPPPPWLGRLAPTVLCDLSSAVWFLSASQASLALSPHWTVAGSCLFPRTKMYADPQPWAGG